MTTRTTPPDSEQPRVVAARNGRANIEATFATSELGIERASEGAPLPLVNDEAEAAIISACLIDADAAAYAAANVDEDDFSSLEFRILFAAIKSRVKAGVPVDPITIGEELAGIAPVSRNWKDLAAAMYGVVLTSANVAAHHRIIADLARRRRALGLSRELQRRIEAGVGDLSPVLTRLASLTNATRHSRYRLLTLPELDELPEPLPLIEGVAFRDSLVSVIGKYGSFKSFLLLDWLMCVAVGADWNGRRVAKGLAVYVFAEGAYGIRQRVTAWRAHYQFAGDADIRFLPTAVDFTQPAQVASLVAEIERLPEKPSAIGIDTIARCMTGDESSSEAMGRFIAGCDVVRQATGATVFAAHHAGWSQDRSRGSSALPAAVDTEILLERDDTLLTVKCTKMKDAPEFAPINLEALQTAGSLVLRAFVPDRADLTRNERHLLAVVQASDGLTSTTWRDATRLGKGSFDNARRRLLALAYVKLQKNRYEATDAGKIVLGTRDKTGTTDGQQPRSPEGQHTHTPKGVCVVHDPQLALRS